MDDSPKNRLELLLAAVLWLALPSCALAQYTERTAQSKADVWHSASAAKPSPYQWKGVTTSPSLPKPAYAPPTHEDFVRAVPTLPTVQLTGPKSFPAVTPVSNQQDIADFALPSFNSATPSPQVQVPASPRTNTQAPLAQTDPPNQQRRLQRSQEYQQRPEPQTQPSIPQHTGPGSAPGYPASAFQTPNVNRNDSLPPPVNEAINDRYQRALDALPNMATQGRPVFKRQEPVQPAPVARSQLPSPLDALPPSVQQGVVDSRQRNMAPQPLPQVGTSKPESEKPPKYDGPFFIDSYGEIKGPHTDVLAKQVPYQAGDFLGSPVPSQPVDPLQEINIYRGKSPVPVQRPLIEWGRPLYTSGLYPPAKNWFGDYNLIMPHFMVYGDFRTGVGINRNAAGDTHNWAFRANLDMDLEITATERIHAFMAPLDRGGDFTLLDFTNSADWVNRTDLRLDTLFFEGDAGAIWGGMTGQDAPFDLPFSFGFLPVFYQNGVWANDNVMGAAFAIPAKHSKLLKWSNFDASFFWASDQINSDAFPGDNNAAEFFGTAWFIEAYDGYIEADYAFVHDDTGQHRSYHNFSVAFSRRYFHRVSNSIRFITNFDQALPRDQRTAQGHMLIIENSLISKTPNTFVPYLNFFYGQGRTQSLARAGVAGGILNNIGINFETDGLTGYPTLDATGVNTTGAAFGLNILGSNFDQQLILEAAALAANGSPGFRNAPGDQYAVGMRYQKPLSNAWIFRTDHMVGFRRSATDLRGSRIEFRWKF